VKKNSSRRPALHPGKKLSRVLAEAAEASGKILEKYYRNRKFRVGEKKGAGLVTDADLASEAAAMRILRRAEPQFEMLAEESAPDWSHELKHEGRWVMDPLDGTTNFVHGFPMFCVSIAAEWRGQVVAGVIHHPILKETYIAVRGAGARMNGKPLRVSATRKAHDALLTTGFTYRKDEWLEAEMKAFEHFSKVARAIRRPGSAALDLAYTARGVFDGFWERRLPPWDVAAGSLLVEEAGGKVSSFSGGDFSITKPEILASNGLLHQELVREMHVGLQGDSPLLK
jgi:myo-inositol-1(or 4)-monophosphatase